MYLGKTKKMGLFSGMANLLLMLQKEEQILVTGEFSEPNIRTKNSFLIFKSFL